MNKEAKQQLPCGFKIPTEMKQRVRLVATSACLSALMAIADDKTFGDGLIPDFLKQYDVNEDGLIDVEERQAIHSSSRETKRGIRRTEIGIDNYRILTDAERLIAQEETRERIALRRAEEFSKVAGQDELMSREELAATPYLVGATERRLNALFKRLDADGSGEVNFDEFIARLRSYRQIPASSNGNSSNSNNNSKIAKQIISGAGQSLIENGSAVSTNESSLAELNLGESAAAEVAFSALGIGQETPVQESVEAGIEQAQRYIAVFGDQVRDIPAAIQAIEKQQELGIKKKFKNAIRGFSFLAGKAVANGLSKRPDIKYVVADSAISTFAQNLPTGIDRVDADLVVAIDGQDNDLLNQVNVAVIDTGIDADHADLNIIGGKRFYINNGLVASDNNFDDDHGHGTFVAGTIGAVDNTIGTVGAAPGVGLYAVKVLDSNGAGYTSVIIEGLDHIIDLNLDNNIANDIHVANMSIGGGFNRALNEAVQGAIQQGIVCVVAAGNSAADSKNFSPASAPDAITVSALADSDGQPGGFGGSTTSGSDDFFATFSNYGSVVDLCAPGVNILGPIPGAYVRASGTSFAAPHVSGAAALYIANSSNPYRGMTGLNAAKVVERALLESAWNSGDPEYLLGGDSDGVAEPILNIGSLTFEYGQPNTSPELVISNPIHGAVYTVGEQVTLSGSATDQEDGSLSQKIRWSSNIDDSLGTGGSLAVSLSEGTHIITARVSDSAGLQSSSSVSVEVLPQEVPNTSPELVISNPIDGAVYTVGEQVTLSGSATDQEDGSLSQKIRWSSNIDDSLGTGGSLAVSLSEGTHIITARVSDSAGLQSSSSVTVEVLPEVTSNQEIIVSQVNFSAFGGRRSDKHLTATLKLVDDSGRSIEGAVVTVKILNEARGSVSNQQGLTDSSGLVRFDIKNAKPGTYNLEVISIEKAGIEWNGETPLNSFQK